MSAALSETPRRRALITGASAGIGEAFARAFAAEGFDLILTARRADRLEMLSRDITVAQGVDVVVLPADLADPNAPAALMQAVTARGLTVDALVNNAGYGINKTFTDASWAEHRDFIQVMMTAVAELTHLVLPGMTARGYGRIITVASVAGLLPGTVTHTLYGASKSFLVKMSESLFLELEGTGVHVVAVCPGFTFSEFHDVNGTRDTVRETPRWAWMTAEAVAAQGVRAVMEGRSPVLVNGLFNRLVTAFVGTLPFDWQLSLSRLRARRRGQ